MTNFDQLYIYENKRYENIFLPEKTLLHQQIGRLFFMSVRFFAKKLDISKVDRKGLKVVHFWTELLLNDS